MRFSIQIILLFLLSQTECLSFDSVRLDKSSSLFIATDKQTAIVTAQPVEVKQTDDPSSGWQRDILADTASPIDLSFLNANDLPAGKHGFVKALADKLVFEDGTPVKFWGTNLVAYALFSSSDAAIEQHARRIAQLGFNLVRIHHHDSAWVSPNIFKNPERDTQELSEDSLRKLDWWIKCLKDQGVYVWLDLQVGRSFTKQDGIEHFEEIAKGKDQSVVNGYNYYNDSIQKQMKAFNEAYLSHVNGFTTLAYKDDPAVLALMLTNENDLSHHYGNLFLPDKGVPIHGGMFIEEAKKFSDKYDLSYNKTWRSWEMGESKLYLNDVEHRFNEKMLTDLRRFNVKQLVVTSSSWGEMGLSGLPSLTDGDLIDAHSYGQADEFKRNPRSKPSFLAWIAGSQVSGKPLSVTEWAIHHSSGEDRFTAPLYTASIAALQGWDAMMLFGYSQQGLEVPGKDSGFSFFNDPVTMGLMPAAALLYRQDQTSSAQKSYQLRLSRNDFFFKRIDPPNSQTIRTLLEASRLTIAMPDTPELPWLKANAPFVDGEIMVTDPDKDFIPTGQDFVVSDTGELKRDWAKGIHTINADKAQVASGWIGGESIRLSNVSFNITTKKAVVAVQSLEDKPIAKSKKLFITIMASSRLSQDKLSSLAEPVTGEISIEAPDNLKLYPITNTGKLAAAVNIKNTQGRYSIKLDGLNSHWFMLM